MKFRVYGMLAALSFAVAALGADRAEARPVPVFAQKKIKAKTKAKVAAVALKEPAKMSGTLKLTPTGVKWGVSVAALSKIYDKVFDKQFVPLYKKTQPGVAMTALDAEVADKKKLIKRNQIDFGTLPTGVDQSALKGEYSYGNKESMTRLTQRSGVTRNFFFFSDKLWKVYDEHKLKKGGAYGENWEEALAILKKKYGGVEPYKLEPDYAKGRMFEEAQWQDKSGTVIRAINRSPVLGLVYSDASIHFNLAKYRTHKPPDPLRDGQGRGGGHGEAAGRREEAGGRRQGQEEEEADEEVVFVGLLRPCEPPWDRVPGAASVVSLPIARRPWAGAPQS